MAADDDSSDSPKDMLCVCVFFSAVFWDISVVDRFGSDRFFFRFLSWDSDDAILKDLAWILQLSHFGS